MSAMYAYVQPGLISVSPRTIIEELEESARALGGSVWGRAYAQAPSPSGELWALVTAFDHAHDRSVAATLAQDIVSLRARQCLQRAGLADITIMVDALLTEMVADVVHTSAHAPGDPDQLHIAVLYPPETTTVVIDLVETRDRSRAPIGDGLQQICMQTGATPHRWRSDTDGTLTRCLFPLPDTLPPTMAQPAQPRR